ncbi:pantetheine-phosphate adenylyltransferase [Sphingobacterium hungaricum]|uniref:Phosphopantetheine adenylyltransferase n=1 Tax=Sphingobacterium hungaricum TaxID=2082723 RepID=A0A928UYC8_9SPHI|nr:pantetheine-phosphate adenylyltransferase [Sphingobacterium hungaricum]MBE8714952.1 pantetheine-phosphate adenylyltransferase [Sphingobacterium hungaricum]
MNIAVFPGSFDPFTNAHQDLVERALGLFDVIYIAIGVNSSKKGLMSFDDRKHAIEKLFEDSIRVRVTTYSGLTVQFCEQVNAKFILRGLRNSADLEFENAIAQNNLLLAPAIESYFLMSRSGLAHISSTIVRDILANGGDISQLVPTKIIDFIKKD